MPVTDAAILLAAIAGVALLRHGWRGTKAAIVVGWTLVAAALLAGTMRDGAWGMSMAALEGMMAACVILCAAAWKSAPARATRTRDPIHATGTDAGGRLARRVAVFALVVPVGALAATVLAFGAQAVVRGAGLGDANALVTMLLIQPVAWSVLASVQMLRPGPRGMIAPAVACAAPGLALWALA